MSILFILNYESNKDYYCSYIDDILGWLFSTTKNKH